MKSAGIVRRIDELGRVVIPKELRDSFDINLGDQMEIYEKNGYIVIKKYRDENLCRICGAAENLIEFKGGHICRCCMEEIYESYKH